MQQALLNMFADQLGAGDAGNGNGNSAPISIETIFRALDLVPSPILVGMDPASMDIRSNAAGRELFGFANHNLSQSAPATERPNFVVYSNGELVSDPNELPMQKAGLTGQPVIAPECELRFDNGTVKYIRGRAVPVFGRDGSVRGTIGVFLDITEAREAEKRHALMTDEVRHRAKNTLAIVQAIANMTLKGKLDAEDYVAFCDRLANISRSIDLYTEQPHLAIGDIVKSTLLNHTGCASTQIVASGPEISLPLPALTSLGMAIHELTTNACKYGALSVPTGNVTIRWSELDGLDVLALDWIERGGPTVTPPSRKGFGSRLLAHVLGNPGGKKTKLTYNQEGVECRLYVGLA